MKEGTPVNIETPRTITKDLPELGAMVQTALWKRQIRGENVGFDDFCKGTRRYEKGHLTVQWNRQQEFLGLYEAGKPATGLEKFFVFIYDDPQQMAETLGELGRDALEGFAKLHRNNYGLRSRMDKVLHGENLTDFEAVDEWSAILGGLVGRLNAVKYQQSVPPENRNANEQFNGTARSRVDAEPLATYDFDEDTGLVRMTYILPPKVDSPFKVDGGVGVSTDRQKGLDLALNIARFSHPLVRQFLALGRER